METGRIEQEFDELACLVFGVLLNNVLWLQKGQARARIQYGDCVQHNILEKLF
jgi:hypothetical protein